MQLSTSIRADVVAYWTAPREKLDGKSALDHLFNRLDGMYPGTWSKQFKTEQSLQNWRDECVLTFAEDGITLDQAANGLRECRRQYRDWPPTVPQFAALCNPPVDPMEAYHEAIAGLEARGKGEMGVWSHPAVYWAATGLSRDLLLQAGQFVKDRWAAALKSQLSRGQWEPIPLPRKQLPAAGKSPTAPDEAKRMLAKLGAAGITKAADSEVDHKAWAKKIMARHERGDKSLKPFQLKDARQALGLREE